MINKEEEEIEVLDGSLKIYLIFFPLLSWCCCCLLINQKYWGQQQQRWLKMRSYSFKYIYIYKQAKIKRRRKYSKRTKKNQQMFTDID